MRLIAATLTAFVLSSSRALVPGAFTQPSFLFILGDDIGACAPAPEPRAVSAPPEAVVSASPEAERRVCAIAALCTGSCRPPRLGGRCREGGELCRHLRTRHSCCSALLTAAPPACRLGGLQLQQRHSSLAAHQAVDRGCRHGDYARLSHGRHRVLPDARDGIDGPQPLPRLCVVQVLPLCVTSHAHELLDATGGWRA